MTTQIFTTDVKITSTTGTTGSTNGALVVLGGVGINNNLFVAGDIVCGGGLTYTYVDNCQIGTMNPSTGVFTSLAANTVTTSDNSTNVATTAYVQSNLSNYLTTSSATSTYAPLASPTFTGVPISTTPSTADNTTKIATTAFVQSNLTNYLTTSSASSTYAPKASPSFTGTVNSAGPIRVTSSGTGITPAPVIKIDGVYIDFAVEGNGGGGIVFPDSTVQHTAYSVLDVLCNSDFGGDDAEDGGDGDTRVIGSDTNCYMINVAGATMVLTMPIVFPTPLADGQALELVIISGPGSYTVSGLALDGVTAATIYFDTSNASPYIAQKFRYRDLFKTWFLIS